MKFAVFYPAALFAVSAMLVVSQLGVQAVPIASTVTVSKESMPDAADVSNLAQWGVASAAVGPDLKEDQFNLGQLHSDVRTQDAADLHTD